MGITQSLYTGVTGLSVMADSMSVVANNIANANAKGFKYDRAEFDDLLSLDLTTSSGKSQLGRGARLSRVRTVHTQGGLAVTDRLTDLAIQGNGFFVLNNPKSMQQEAGGQFFTRVGAFNFDKDGFLSDPTGGRLQGYMSKPNGTLESTLSDIRIVTNNLPPHATEKVNFNVNLDARAEILDVDFDINNAEETSNFVNTVTVFDSHGTQHNMTTYFKRINGDDGISWQWFATVPSDEVTDGDEDAPIHKLAEGVVNFTPDGRLLSEETIESSVNFSKGAFPNQVIQFDFGQNVGDEEGSGTGVTSSVAAKSITVFHSQDGYQAGNLKSMSVDLDGRIKGYYTNGIQNLMSCLAMATFENVDGLKKAGRNQFYRTLSSGSPRIGEPQTGTRGSVYASTLEESNVDLAGEFVKMIMTQRGFQANSRSITTTDGMIEEVVNLKR